MTHDSITDLNSPYANWVSKFFPGGKEICRIAVLPALLT